MNNLRRIREHGFNDGYKKAIAEVENIIESIETQYPDDDGTPFEVLACNYKKELKSKLKEGDKRWKN